MDSTKGRPLIYRLASRQSRRQPEEGGDRREGSLGEGWGLTPLITFNVFPTSTLRLCSQFYNNDTGEVSFKGVEIAV